MEIIGTLQKSRSWQVKVYWICNTDMRPSPLEKKSGLSRASEEELLELREPRNERPAMEAEQITVPRSRLRGSFKGSV